MRRMRRKTKEVRKKVRKGNVLRCVTAFAMAMGIAAGTLSTALSSQFKVDVQAAGTKAIAKFSLPVTFAEGLSESDELPPYLEVEYSDGSTGKLSVKWIVTEGGKLISIPSSSGVDVSNDASVSESLFSNDSGSDRSNRSASTGSCEQASDEDGVSSSGSGGEASDEGGVSSSSLDGEVSEENKTSDSSGQNGEMPGQKDVSVSSSLADSDSVAPNEQAVFDFLHNNMGLNSAAAVGILTNIYAESSINPQAAGDFDSNGTATSYGICQWHASRFDGENGLIDWCGSNGYDYTSLDGQLHYLQYEAETNYPNTTAMVRSVTNNADGARQAAFDWCLYYEIPAGGETAAALRGNMAIDRGFFFRHYDGFWDVTDPSRFYYNPVYWAKGRGITGGIGTDAEGHSQFGVGQNCTREQIIAFLYRAAGSPAVSGVNPFTDAQNGWYRDAIEWGYENGIVNGVGTDAEGRSWFGVGQSCTRAQIVTFLYRAVGSPAVSGTNPFTDLPSGWYQNAVQWAYENGVTGGTSGTTFGPDGTCTREQAVTFLYRTFD